MAFIWRQRSGRSGELKEIGKAFVVLVNSIHPYSEETINVVQEIRDKYDVEVMAVNASQLHKEDILEVMERILPGVSGKPD